ncbi:MAG: hypothetical protein ACOYOK_00190 [Pseudobdellovibrionaceae bacterium]
MENSNIKGRFHIYTGYRKGSVICHELQAGEAYGVEGPAKLYYIVKMWAFPREVFYLTSNRSEDGNFTLFAKKLGNDSDPIFRRPVGFGFVSRDLKKHLEIQFTFPRQRVFMSLFPDKVTVDSLLGVDGGVVA